EVDAEPGALGHPHTDPLARAIAAGLRFPPVEGRRPYAVATFPGRHVLEQLRAVGLEPVQESEPADTNNKLDFKRAAARYGFAVPPWIELGSPADAETVAREYGRSRRGGWLKLAHGAGGDTVRHLPAPFDGADVLRAFASLKDAAETCFTKGDFGPGAWSRFWPAESFATSASPVFFESDVGNLGRIVGDFSRTLILPRSGPALLPFFSEKVTDHEGTSMGHRPISFQRWVSDEVDRQMQAAADYARAELRLFGVVGVDFMLVETPSGELAPYLVEMNGRPPASYLSRAMADKLGARHWAHVTAATDVEVNTPGDFLELAGDLATGSFDDGAARLTALKSQYVHDGGRLVLTRPGRSVRMLIASNRGPDDVQRVIAELGGRGFRLGSRVVARASARARPVARPAGGAE
ncbi:MAG TPA: hypothetical protein VK576_10130, partial [Thermoleophilia bacterium]|nr:hypothetical protein [Thermoleophilia bacterium]